MNFSELSTVSSATLLPSAIARQTAFSALSAPDKAAPGSFSDGMLRFACLLNSSGLIAVWPNSNSVPAARFANVDFPEPFTPPTITKQGRAGITRRVPHSSAHR
jgi:hypothetical protein